MGCRLGSMSFPVQASGDLLTTAELSVCTVYQRTRCEKPFRRMTYFGAMRAWDTRAEFGYMKQIEDDFQEVALRIINRSVPKIEGTDKCKVDQFFCAVENACYVQVQRNS